LFLRCIEYVGASGILGALRNSERMSTIIEMPDVEEHLFSCVLCLSSPVEW
jgi:hypothetical protein